MKRSAESHLSTTYTQIVEKILGDPTFRVASAVTGPVAFRKRINYHLAINPEANVLVDLFIVESAGKTPLAVIIHGNHSRKEAHRYQAESLASWGISSMVVQLHNEGRWLANSGLIENLVRLIYESPRVIHERIDRERIVLVGHSFGGSAVTLATAQGAPVRGMILLDPAVVHHKVVRAMRRVHIPTVLLGADTKVFRSKKRAAFFHRTKGEMLELSMVGATHDDAQAPSMFSIYSFGRDPFTSDRRRNLFRKAIVWSAYSILGTGGLEYLHRQVEQERKRGVVKDIRYRSPALAEFADDSESRVKPRSSRVSARIEGL